MAASAGMVNRAIDSEDLESGPGHLGFTVPVGALASLYYLHYMSILLPLYMSAIQVIYLQYKM